MTALAFLAGVVTLATLIVVALARFLGTRIAAVAAVVLLCWLSYAGALSLAGVVANPALKPPGIVYIILPVSAFVGKFAVRSARGGALAAALPLWLLTGAQVFRVGVEVGMHALWRDGLVPALMSYQGGNLDILIGASAVPVAWLAARGRIAPALVTGWNIVGMLSLLNIITRSALSAPGPLNFFHAEVPNLAIGLFPYTYIAAFFAPLAMVLHVLSIRHVRATRRSGIAAAPIVQAVP